MDRYNAYKQEQKDYDLYVKLAEVMPKCETCGITKYAIVTVLKPSLPTQWSLELCDRAGCKQHCMCHSTN